MMYRVTLAAMLVMMTACAVLAQTAPVVTITYDDDLDGVRAAGAVEGTPVGNPALVDGKFGKALKSGPATGYVDYPLEGIVNSDAGTVELWVCPLDWQPKDREFHVFFEAVGEGAIYLYKYWENKKDLYMLSCNEVTGPYTISTGSIEDWQPGQWHHLAGTWSRSQGRVVCYVDGKPGVPSIGHVPESLSGAFRIGDAPWSKPRTSSSLIDEVRIYDRALSAEHVAAHYQGNHDFALAPTKDLASLRYEVAPAEGTVQVWLDMGGADVADARLGARIAMIPHGGEIPENTAAVPLQEGQATAGLPLISKSPGSYQIAAEVTLDNRKAFELRERLRIPGMEWQGNRIGMEDKVLPPWTPMQVQGTTLSCWGREYAFGKRAFPIQIAARGEEILARPIHLSIGDGNKAVWQEESVRVVEQSDTRVELLGEMRGKTDNGAPLNFTVRSTAEYDGLLLVELTCHAGDTAQPDRISLDIPITEEHALYLHRYETRHGAKSGSVPAGKGVVQQFGFCPYIWLGDNDRGLFWFCESDQYWPHGTQPDAIQIVRSDGEVTLRLNILAPGEKLPSNWRFVFGIQATPVKPLPEGWRKWRLNKNIVIPWPHPVEDSLKYFGYPEAANPQAFSQMVERYHDQGKKVAIYSCLTHLSAAAPEWDFFGKTWSSGQGYSFSADVANYGAPFVKVSPSALGFADFIVWKNKQFIERYGLDGLYHDNTVPYPSAHLDAGCGYLRAGKAYPTHPILAYRELYRRIYAVMKSQPHETLLIAHVSPFVTSPILAYEDMYVIGENFRDQVEESYMDVITLDQFRAAYMGRQWGLISTFIPGLRGDRIDYYKKAVRPTRGLMALLMLHDVTPWPTLCNVAVLEEAWKALDEFDHIEAEFLPYWQILPPASTDMEDVYASAYKRADGQVLLIVANLGDADLTGRLRLHLTPLGFAPGAIQVISWPDKAPVELTGDSVTIKVPGLGYRMLVLERTL